MADTAATYAPPTDTALLLQQLARELTRGAGPRQMHGGQWAVLREVKRLGRQANVGEIATALGVTHAPASRAIDALDRKGLIRKSADQDDRRVCRLTLTQKGDALLADDPLQLVRQALIDLGARERVELHHHVAFLLTRFKEPTNG